MGPCLWVHRSLIHLRIRHSLFCLCVSLPVQKRRARPSRGRLWPQHRPGQRALAGGLGEGREGSCPSTFWQLPGWLCQCEEPRNGFPLQRATGLLRATWAHRVSLRGPRPLAARAAWCPHRGPVPRALRLQGSCTVWWLPSTKRSPVSWTETLGGGNASPSVSSWGLCPLGALHPTHSRVSRRLILRVGEARPWPPFLGHTRI